jgi:hypothetical protein
VSPDDPRSDSPATGRDRQRDDLLNSLAIISDRARLLQRQILDANGLMNLERDQMLGSLATMRRELEALRTQLEALIDSADPPSDALEDVS